MRLVSLFILIMSLPAGFFTTTVDGLRCTAVPRTATTLPASLAALPAATPSSTSTAVVATPTPVSSSDTPSVAQSAAPTSTSSPQVAATPIAASTPVSSFVTSTSALVLSTSASSAIQSASAIPGSAISTPTTTSSSAVAIAQSEVSASPTPLSTDTSGNGVVTPSQTTTSSSSSDHTAPSASRPAESSAQSGISSNPKLTAAPVVGGVLGSMALIAIVGLIFWFIRRRRRGRESLLTPLTTGRRGSFYDADNATVAPTREERWRSNFGYKTDRLRNAGSGVKAGIVGFGTALISKVGGPRSGTPNVNLNRGNSQFMDGPIPQHSRNNSVLSQSEKPTVKERAADWWEWFCDKFGFAMRMRSNKELEDPFAVARSMSEEKAQMNKPTDFSQLLRMDDRELQLQAERRRISLVGNTNSLPQLGSLGLNFGSPGDDPFADPVRQPPPSTNPASNPFADPATNRSDPFADPVAKPGPTIPKGNTYIADIRRARGTSTDNTNTNSRPISMYRPPSTAVGSRYPSSIPTSRDSYRDTVFSSFSANVRKGKGRSDPFDLERPELWTASPALQPNALNLKNGPPMPSGNDPRVKSNTSHLSKYSSGMSMGEWGDPGPDLGPGSLSSSLAGNASSNEMYSPAVYSPAYGQQPASATENWDANRGKNSVSPLSRTSSKGSTGVGKAM